MVGGFKCVVPVARPLECSVKGDVSSSDKDEERGNQEQTDRDCSAVIEKLVSNGSVQHEYPGRCSDRGNVDCDKSLQNDVSTTT